MLGPAGGHDPVANLVGLLTGERALGPTESDRKQQALLVDVDLRAVGAFEYFVTEARRQQLLYGNARKVYGRLG